MAYSTNQEDCFLLTIIVLIIVRQDLLLDHILLCNGVHDGWFVKIKPPIIGLHLLWGVNQQSSPICEQTTH